QGKPGTDNNTRARAHKSLPQPLLIRITFHDQHGKKATQEVFQINKPLPLATKESLEKSWKLKPGEIEEFIYCDDVELLDRIWFALYTNDKKEKVFRWSYSSYYQW